MIYISRVHFMHLTVSQRLWWINQINESEIDLNQKPVPSSFFLFSKFKQLRTTTLSSQFLITFLNINRGEIKENSLFFLALCVLFCVLCRSVSYLYVLYFILPS